MKLVVPTSAAVAEFSAPLAQARRRA